MDLPLNLALAINYHTKYNSSCIVIKTMSELIPASSLWPQDGVWSNPHREELQYFITIAGPPASMPRPTSMAWLKDGKLKKRVFNGKANEIKSFREEYKSQLTGKVSLPFRSTHPTWSRWTSSFIVKSPRPVTMLFVPIVALTKILP